MTSSPRAAFLQSFAATAVEHGGAPGTWLQALVEAFIRQHALSVDTDALALFGPPWSEAEPVPASVASSWSAHLAGAQVDLLGQAHEALLDAGQRHARGVFYTPSDVAASLAALVLPDVVPDPDRGEPVPVVLDPAVGGGAFLVAMAVRLERLGWSRAEIVGRALWGIDIDPLAIAITDAALRCWAASGPGGSQDAQSPWPTNLAVNDTLRNGPLVFPEAPAVGFDAVVGNPPFQSQLASTTSRTASDTAELGPWLGTAAYRYADTATVFLAAALRLVRPGGRVALILPQSFLVADDAAKVRDVVLATSTLEHLWVAPEPIFAAQVRVCAPVVRRGERARTRTGAVAGRSGARPQRWRGRTFEPMGKAAVDPRALGPAATWAPLVADLFGLPVVSFPPGRSADGDGVACLGDMCTATAGFRDQYYGLVGHVREATGAEQQTLAAPGNRDPAVAALAPLLTCGLIGPVWSDWGRRTTKFAKQTWSAPVVDLETLARDEPALHRWTMARRVPKLVVATQTRVIEAVVDDGGRYYPSVPSIALACDPARLWSAAAVVMAPVVSLWAFHHHVGAALSSDALKVSARQLLAAPLPPDRPAWERSAAALQAAHRCGVLGDTAGWLAALDRFARASVEAYRLSADDAAVVVDWWLSRLPAPAPSPPARTRAPRRPAGEHPLAAATTARRP